MDDLRAFPATARREAGHQLDRVQNGDNPDDWKPIPSVGPGVREVRVHDQAGAFRVVYIATRPEAVYVLHAFQKKSPFGIRTAMRDVDLVAERLKAAQKDHEEHYGKSTR